MDAQITPNAGDVGKAIEVGEGVVFDDRQRTANTCEVGKAIKVDKDGVISFD